MSDWQDEMESTYGVDRSWIVPYSWQFAPCVSGNCDQYGNAYFYQVSGNINVPDPAESIKTNLASYGGLADWLNDTAFLASTDLFNGMNSDVVDGASLSVYSVVGAVAAMQKVEEIAKKYEDAEALQIILFFVSAILILLPGIGEELSVAFDASIFARMGSLLSNAGNIALTALDIAKDPSSAPLAIGGLLIGGLASRDSEAFSTAAAARRQLPDSVMKDLGTDVSTGMGKLSTKYKLCKL